MGMSSNVDCVWVLATVACVVVWVFDEPNFSGHQRMAGMLLFSLDKDITGVSSTLWNTSSSKSVCLSADFRMWMGDSTLWFRCTVFPSRSHTNSLKKSPLGLRQILAYSCSGTSSRRIHRGIVCVRISMLELHVEMNAPLAYKRVCLWTLSSFLMSTLPLHQIG